MWKYLIKINKNLVYAIPTFMIAGFIFGVTASPQLVKSLKTLIIPLTFLMVYPMMVTPEHQAPETGAGCQAPVPDPAD